MRLQMKCAIFNFAWIYTDRQTIPNGMTTYALLVLLDHTGWTRTRYIGFEGYIRYSGRI